MTNLLLKINCATCTCIIIAINMQSLQTQGEATPSSYRTVLYDDGVAENISTLTKYPTVIIVQLMIVGLKLLSVPLGCEYEWLYVMQASNIACVWQTCK